MNTLENKSTHRGYKLNPIKVNGIWFKGQFAVAYKKFENGEIITMDNFKCGNWESTSKVSRFLELLQYSNVPFEYKGKSLRTVQIFKSKEL